MKRKLEDFTLKFSPDGVILDPPVAELYVSALAEGDERDLAWKTAGGTMTHTQQVLRAAIEGHPDFGPYLALRMKERADIICDRYFGEAIQMIRVQFTEARAKRDKVRMDDAVRLRLDAAKAAANLKIRLSPPAAAAPAAEKPPANPVGRPSPENPQARAEVSDMRDALLRRGIKNAPQPPDEDAA